MIEKSDGGKRCTTNRHTLIPSWIYSLQLRPIFFNDPSLCESSCRIREDENCFKGWYVYKRWWWEMSETWFELAGSVQRDGGRYSSFDQSGKYTEETKEVEGWTRKKGGKWRYRCTYMYAYEIHRIQGDSCMFHWIVFRLISNGSPVLVSLKPKEIVIKYVSSLWCIFSLILIQCTISESKNLRSRIMKHKQRSGENELSPSQLMQTGLCRSLWNHVYVLIASYDHHMIIFKNTSGMLLIEVPSSI